MFEWNTRNLCEYLKIKFRLMNSQAIYSLELFFLVDFNIILFSHWACFFPQCKISRLFFNLKYFPHRDVQKIQFYSSTSSPKKYSRQSDFSKYNKTIYDVLLHLSGKMPPGISASQSLPVDDTERVLQLHLQHSSLLDFLT
jgi:hypothetical protein